MKIRTHMIGISFLVVIFTTVLFAILLITSMRQMYLDSVTGEIRRQAVAYAEFYKKFWQTGAGRLDDSATRLLASSPFEVNAEIMILNTNGRQLADSLPLQFVSVEDYSDVREAQVKGSAQWIGKLAQSGEPVAAVTVALDSASGTRDGYIRIVSSLRPMQRRLAQDMLGVGSLAAVVILIAGMFALLANRSVTRRFGELSGAVQGFAAGDMSVRLNTGGNDEFSALAVTLNQMAQRIEHDENSKNGFLASVSHELKTPLTSIKGWAVTLRCSDAADGDVMEEGFDIIESECDRLQSVLDELLDYSAIVEGRMNYFLQLTDLSDLLEKCILQMMPLARGKGLEIVSDLQTSCHNEVDPSRMKQVFINILGNAVKFTPEGGKVTVRLMKTTEALVIEVADNGLGIAQDALPRIREKFFKGDSRKPGSGLGLAICDEILVAHQARMQIENHSEGGTVVRIYLPFDLNSM